MKEERYENPEKQSIQNKQLNIPNKYLNWKPSKQSGASWKQSIRN
jgi:hypothetical protein